MLAFWLQIKFFIDNFPNRLSVVLFGSYNPARDADPAHLEFWMREFCHTMGGIPFGILLYLCKCPWYLAPVFTWLLMMLKEMVDDVTDQGGQLNWKNFADPSFWALGCLITIIILEEINNAS